MQDTFAQFEKNTSLLTAGASGTGYNGGAIGTYVSLNSYDTGAVGVPNAVGPGGTIGGPLLHDLGRGRRLEFLAQITTAVTSAGAATVEVDFISDTNQNLLTAATVLIPSPAIAKASLAAGYRFKHGTTPRNIAQRFVGCQVLIGTAARTAGAYSAGLMLDLEDHADVFG